MLRFLARRVWVSRRACARRLPLSGSEFAGGLAPLEEAGGGGAEDVRTKGRVVYVVHPRGKKA